MPVIPHIFAQEVRSVDQSLSRTGTTPGEAQAHALMRLGEGLARLGSGVQAYEARKAAIDQNLRKNQALNAARKSAIDAADFAMNNADRAPDGSDILDNFELHQGDAKQEYLLGLPEDQRQEAELIWEDQALDRREKLIEQSRTLHAQFAMNRSEQIKNAFVQGVYGAPDTFEDNASRVIEHYDTMQVAGLVTSDQAEKLKKVATKEMALSAINGMVERDRDYKKAVDEISFGKMGMLFNQEERLNTIRYIEERKVRALNLDLQTQALKSAENDRRQKEQQQQSFITSYEQMQVVGDNPELYEQWKNSLDARVASGLVDPKDAAWLMEKQQGLKGDLDERKEYNYRMRLMRGDDPQEVMNALVNDQVIGAKPAIQVLNEIKSWQDRAKTDPNFNEKHQAATRQIKTILFPESFNDKFDFTGAGAQAKSRLLFDAQKAYFQLLSQGVDPLDASEQVVKRFGSPVARMPLVQGYPPSLQISEKGINSIMRDLHSKVDQGKISKEKAALDLEILLARQKALQIEMQYKKLPQANQGGGQ